MIRRNRNSNFVKMMLKNKSSRATILDYLSKPDLEELSRVNKRLGKIVQIYVKNQLKFMNDASFDGILKRMITKSKQKPKRNIYKTNIFEIDFEKMVKPYNWMILNPNEELNKEVIEEISGIIPKKLTKDYSKLIFYCEELKKYLVVNRSLCDHKQEIFHKLNKREKDRMEIDEEEQDKLDMIKLTESKEFALDNFMGSENGMLIRQRMLCERLAMMKEKREEKEITMESDGLRMALEAENVSIVLCAGGYFALVVFKGRKELLHKSDHRYVIRKKQGGRQMLKDKSKKVMTSVGSQMRRLNEVNHQKKIKEILEEERAHIEASDYVLVHSPGENKAILFDEGRALYDFRQNGNFRSVNIEPKRANYSEAKRIFEEVIKVYIVSEDDYF